MNSGASQQYLKNYYKGFLIDTKPATNQVVNLPNNEVMTYSFKGQIPDSLVLLKNTRDAHVFKDTHSASIICLVQLCDDG